jgi:methylmalonyl-CoA/ethylmalonyl-CoA epimerase
MSDIGTLQTRIADGFFQQAFVVADLAAAEAAMRDGLGCPAFVDLPATDLDYELRGQPTQAALAIGFTRSGNVQIELIQPVRGESIHAEFLAAHGSGSHHCGYLVDRIDDVVALAAKAGFGTVMGGQFGSLRFCYLDTWDALGLYTELVEDPDEMMMALMPWK